METTAELNPIEDVISELLNLTAMRADWTALKQHVADVSDRYREKKGELDDLIALKEEQWAQENSELISECEEIRARFKQIDTQLRAAIVNAFDANPERKTVAPGLSVRVTEKIVTTDAKARLAWVKENAPVCLVVDESAFEKLIKGMAPETRLDFVKIEENVTTVISEDKAK